MPLAAPKRLLLLLLLLAALHSATAALVRPLYQVSDEVNYLISVQREALGGNPRPALVTCISPGTGAAPPLLPGGKPLFHWVGARALGGLCAAGAGALAPIILRLILSLSLVIVTYAGWHTARVVGGGIWVPAVTALALATQPVLAKYAGAVTPDSLANACAALAVLAAVRWIVLGPGLSRLAALLAWTALAAAMKDAALFLVPVNGLVLMTAVLPSGDDRSTSRGTWPVVLGGIVLAALIALQTRTAYQIGPGLTAAGSAPLAFVLAVVIDATAQLPSFVTSSWTSLGGFGGGSATLPSTAGVIVGLLWAVAGLGLARATVTFGGAERQVRIAAAYLGLAFIACLLQAPVRQVLLQTVDQHQGRWLFPAAVPVAVAFAIGGRAALGDLAERAWPLLTGSLVTVVLLATTAVAQWHVAGPDWSLDHRHLYLHATGGLDVGRERILAQIVHAWPAAGGIVATLLLLLVGGCGVLLMRSGPSSERTFSHVQHADHR